MQRILVGVDYGRKKMGLAFSTQIGSVHPRPRLERRTLPEDLQALYALAEEVHARAFVLGLPHNMDGSQSEMEAEVRVFAKQLAGHGDLPVYGVDERLTTEAAEEMLREAQVDARKRKLLRDSAAACILLQDVLQGGAETEPLR